MKLRAYQTKIISEVLASWQSGKRRVMACAPSGSGKTVLFAAIAEKTSSRCSRRTSLDCGSPGRNPLTSKAEN